MEKEYTFDEYKKKKLYVYSFRETTAMSDIDFSPAVSM